MGLEMKDKYKMEREEKQMETLADKIANAIERYHVLFMRKKVLKTVEEIEATSDPLEKYIAGAGTVGELYNNLVSRPDWITDSTGKITGYKTPGGADTVFPFSDFSEESLVFISPQLRGSANQGQTMKQEYNVYVEKNRKYLFVYYQSSAVSITVTVNKDNIAKTIQMNRNPTISNISTGIYEADQTGQVTVTVNTKFSSDLSVYYAIFLAFA